MMFRVKCQIYKIKLKSLNLVLRYIPEGKIKQILDSEWRKVALEFHDIVEKKLEEMKNSLC